MKTKTKAKIIGGIAIGLTGTAIVLATRNKAQDLYADSQSGPAANPNASGAGATAAAAAVSAAISEKQARLAEQTKQWSEIELEINDYTQKIDSLKPVVKADEDNVNRLQSDLTNAQQAVNNYNLLIAQDTDTDQWVRAHLAEWFAVYKGINPRYYGKTEIEIFYAPNGGAGGDLLRNQGNLSAAENKVQECQNALDAPYQKLAKDQGDLTAYQNQKSILITMHRALGDTIDQIRNDIEMLKQSL